MSSEERGTAVILGANGRLMSKNFMVHVQERQEEFPLDLVGLDIGEPHEELYPQNGFARWVDADMIAPSQEAKDVLREARAVYHSIMASEKGGDHFSVQLNTMMNTLKFMDPRARLGYAGSNSAIRGYTLVANLGRGQKAIPAEFDSYGFSKKFNEDLVQEHCELDLRRNAVGFRITHPDKGGWERSHMGHQDFGESILQSLIVSSEQLFADCEDDVQHTILQLCHPDALHNANTRETQRALGYECQHPPDWTKK
ncbi:hypothetical protein CMI48_00040 [Candidatus Pacearchaeota archaeon]|nr:hypothetical protein [Candidatus Pacearchaeota archaeon]